MTNQIQYKIVHQVIMNLTIIIFAPYKTLIQFKIVELLIIPKLMLIQKIALRKKSLMKISNRKFHMFL